MADMDTLGEDDDFGPEQEVPYQGGDDDGWGSFDSDWNTPESGSDFDSGQGSAGIQDSGVGQGSFIQPDDDGWGRTSGVEEPQINDTVPSDFASSTAQIQEFQPRQFNLSMKKVALIVGVVGVLLALLLLGLSKIHFSPKQPSNPTPPPQQVEQQPPQQEPSGNQGTSAADVDKVVLVEIPDSMKLDYNGDVLEMNAKVISKLKYVQGHQVLYCVNLGVALGASSETVSYYCNLSSFNAVSEGDIVIIKYQQVNDSYISIMSISK